MNTQQYIRNKIEFSKKILIVSYIIAISITIFTCILAFLQKDISSFSAIVLSCWGEVTVGNAFYYWKARSENKVKIISSLNVDVLDKVSFNLDKDS